MPSEPERAESGFLAPASAVELQALAQLRQLDRYKELNVHDLRARESLKLESLHTLSSKADAWRTAKKAAGPTLGCGTALVQQLANLTKLTRLQLEQTSLNEPMVLAFANATRALSKLEVCMQMMKILKVDALVML